METSRWSTSNVSIAIRDAVEIVADPTPTRAVLDRALDSADTLFWSVPPDPKADSVRSAYVDFSRPLTGAINERRGDDQRGWGAPTTSASRAVPGPSHTPPTEPTRNLGRRLARERVTDSGTDRRW